MPKQFLIRVLPSTTPEIIDKQLEKVYANKEMVEITWDLTCLKFFKMSKMLSIKPILDKHRVSTRKYLSNSNIVVTQPLVRYLLRMSIYLLHPEKPFKIIKQQFN